MENHSQRQDLLESGYPWKVGSCLIFYFYFLVPPNAWYNFFSSRENHNEGERAVDKLHDTSSNTDIGTTKHPQPR